MQFEFPASEQEKKLVHETVSELKKSIALSNELSEKLLSILEENHLAIENSYREEINRLSHPFFSTMFGINIQLYKLEDEKARIVMRPQKENDQQV